MKVVEECLPTKTSTSNSCTEQRSNISKSYDEIPMDISSQSVRKTSADCTSNLLDDPDQTQSKIANAQDSITQRIQRYFFNTSSTPSKQHFITSVFNLFAGFSFAPWFLQV